MLQITVVGLESLLRDKVGPDTQPGWVLPAFERLAGAAGRDVAVQASVCMYT